MYIQLLVYAVNSEIIRKMNFALTYYQNAPLRCPKRPLFMLLLFLFFVLRKEIWKRLLVFTLLLLLLFWMVSLSK